METVQQNGRFTLFSSKLHSNIYSILFADNSKLQEMKGFDWVKILLHSLTSKYEYYPRYEGKYFFLSVKFKIHY